MTPIRLMKKSYAAGLRSHAARLVDLPSVAAYLLSAAALSGVEA